MMTGAIVYKSELDPISFKLLVGEGCISVTVYHIAANEKVNIKFVSQCMQDQLTYPRVGLKVA